MKKNYIIAIIAVVILFIIGLLIYNFSNNNINNNVNMNDIKNLTKQEISMAQIAANTATGNINKLEIALSEGLDNGLTINQIKEVILHVYAYAGFPRSLNGLGAFQNVLKTREEQGITDAIGEEPTPVENASKFEMGADKQTELVGMSFNYQFVPGMDSFLKEHLFADLYGRGVLSDSQRELVTIAVLTALDGTESQLGSHINMGMNAGLTLEQVTDVINLIDNTKANLLDRFKN